MIISAIIIWIPWFPPSAVTESSPSTCSNPFPLRSPNQLLPVIADNSWKKDSFKGNHHSMQISTFMFLKVPRIWSPMRIRTCLRSSLSSATSEQKSGTISVFRRCLENSRIWGILTARISDRCENFDWHSYKKEDHTTVKSRSGNIFGATRVQT